MDLVASLDHPPAGKRDAVWFAADAYCAVRLARDGRIPYHAPSDLGAFLGKARGLLRSDALLLDLADFFREYLLDHSELLGAMKARGRAGFALRTMLADDGARAVANEAASVFVASAGSAPVLLTLPAPPRWLAIAAGAALGEPAEEGSAIDADLAEMGAMYVADFLRSFVASGIDGVMLDEGATRPEDLIDSEAYRAALNVADHYGWPVIVRTDAAPCWPRGSVTGITAWIGSSAPAAGDLRWGVLASPQKWLDGAGLPPGGGGPVLVPVPADSDSSLVMARVRELG